jgi:hypothetical protein
MSEGYEFKSAKEFWIEAITTLSEINGKSLRIQY